MEHKPVDLPAFHTPDPRGRQDPPRTETPNSRTCKRKEARRPATPGAQTAPAEWADEVAHQPAATARARAQASPRAGIASSGASCNSSAGLPISPRPGRNASRASLLAIRGPTRHRYTVRFFTAFLTSTGKEVPKCLATERATTSPSPQHSMATSSRTVLGASPADLSTP